MSSKPESSFRRGVEKYIPEVHHEKMSNPYRSGGADAWYSGNKGDCWVEYKYVVIPKHAAVRPTLSALQSKWLGERHREGRDVYVIIGCREGGVILQNPEEWDTSLPCEVFRDRLRSRNAIAAFIKSLTGEGAHASRKTPNPNGGRK